MFFFFEQDNAQISYLAFETYVLDALKKYVTAQGKEISIYTDKDFYDAYLPKGIDEIVEPLNVEIKYFDSDKKNLYFQNIAKDLERIDKLDETSLLLILGADFKEKSIESMQRMFQKHSSKKVYIWTSSMFYEKTNDYLNRKFEDVKNKNAVLVDYAINNDQTEKDKKEVQESVLARLKQKYANEEVVLFLGAGVSMDAGLPSWDTLVQRLLTKMISNKLESSKINPEHLDEIIKLAYDNQDGTSITQMRYIRSAFDTVEYNRLVHEALYLNNLETKSELLDAISLICAPTRNHIGIQGIVTYNFDDLIERKLNADNILNNPIYNEQGCSMPDRLSIFHVHGFLPQVNETDENEHELIFSEEDYHKVYRDAYCWSNIVQLNFLRENTCLFLGCSLTDPNLRRLLDVASRANEKPRHYAVMRKPNITYRKGLQKKDIQLYTKIDMNIKEKCFASMGINLIWVDSYDEIKDILKGLKVSCEA